MAPASSLPAAAAAAAGRPGLDAGQRRSGTGKVRAGPCAWALGDGTRLGASGVPDTDWAEARGGPRRGRPRGHCAPRPLCRRLGREEPARGRGRWRGRGRAGGARGQGHRRPAEPRPAEAERSRAGALAPRSWAAASSCAPRGRSQRPAMPPTRLRGAAPLAAIALLVLGAPLGKGGGAGRGGGPGLDAGPPETLGEPAPGAAGP